MKCIHDRELAECPTCQQPTRFLTWLDMAIRRADRKIRQNPTSAHKGAAKR